MQSNTATSDKHIVELLDFTARTSKRVQWEAWEFAVAAPHLIEVTNASYGFEKGEHTYAVGVEVRDGVALPAECDCPADVHRDEDCKHKLALATVGGPTVLEAAVAFEGDETDSGADTTPPTSEEGLRADGGLLAESGDTPEDCDCEKLNGFPCWPCVRTGRRELPE